MLTILLSFFAALAATAKQPLVVQPLPTVRLPFIENFQFAPEESSTLYGSRPEHYESLMQYFGKNKKMPVGRYCKLDDNSTPFDCVSIQPDLVKYTCAITPYKETSLPVKAIDFDVSLLDQIIFDSNVNDPREKLAAKVAIPKVGFSKVGSPRANVPGNLVVPFVPDVVVAKAEFDKNRSQTSAELIYMSKLACHEFFKLGGAESRFEDARSTLRQRCATHNVSARGLGSELWDCSKVEDQAITALTQVERNKTYRSTSFRDLTDSYLPPKPKSAKQ